VVLLILNKLMSQKFQTNNFIGDLIKHQLSKPKKHGQSGFSRREVNNFKESYRIERQNTICKSESYKEFVKWLNDLQLRLGMNNEEFMLAMGLKSLSSLYKYKRGYGNLPSLKTLKRLQELEKICNKVKVNVIKHNIIIN
jgi:hypothetical protein